ncbi:MAG: HAD hydrolase family protein [Bacilli bacterium]|nr:HAD hydrolase family protein [Bacilli bacterium]
MIKMVVSSFYNTLINKEEAIDMSTMLEIDRIRNEKVLFTISTNGLYKEILDYNKDFPFVDYIISLNGSYIYDVLKDKCIYKQKIAKIDVKKI